MKKTLVGILAWDVIKNLVLALILPTQRPRDGGYTERVLLKHNVCDNVPLRTVGFRVFTTKFCFTSIFGFFFILSFSLSNAHVKRTLNCG